MKTKFAFYLLIFSMVFFISTQVSASETFIPPVTTAQVSQCEYNDTTCGGSTHHAGIDYSRHGDRTVVASNAGVIVEIEPMHDRDHGMGNNIIIKHTLENNRTVYSSYSHLLSIRPGLSENDVVERGEEIGKMGGSGYGQQNHWPIHLHFEMKNSAVTGAPTEPNAYWGYVPGNPDDYGYFNANNFIGSVNAINPTFFDGAGSVIRTSNNCWGCNKDEARMHPHSIPSTVVFQWTAASNCSYLKIGVAENNSGSISNTPLDVVIHTKLWNKHSSEDSYKSTLPITVANKGYWNTTAVTSQKKLSSMVRVIAECTDSSISFSKINIQSLLVDFINNYNWAGNGSLIARDNAPDYSVQDAGVRQDWAVTFNQHKALTIFQWQPSDSCSSLHIDTEFGADGGIASINQIDIKLWDATSWPNENLCSMLPCTITVPSISSYYLVKIKTNAGAVQSGYIHASCQ